MRVAIEERKVLLQRANVYKIEKDVMYLNLIYVYLVTNEKMPFQWETNSIWQFKNKLSGVFLSLASILIMKIKHITKP